MMGYSTRLDGGVRHENMCSVCFMVKVSNASDSF